MKNPFSDKNNCTQCEEKFSNHQDLVIHVRHEHHKTIVKCQKCGKEFIHEKDRLHHAQKEHEEEMRKRSHKSSYPDEYSSTQNIVNKFRDRFSDKL
jgi:hydrogenase maturation factor HypF (carbamoyltransferase family)